VRAHALLGSLLLYVCALAMPALAHSAFNGGAQYGAKKADAQPTPSSAPSAGGIQPGQPGTEPVPGSPTPVVPGSKAVLLPDGSAAAPAAAPPQVQQAIWAANTLQSKPYRYGGGHASFKDSGYDCSGTVSYALNAAGLLKTPLDSSSFARWGQSGRGDWITVYTNPGHAYVVIAGLRLDTSAAYASRARASRKYPKATEKGPRWRPSSRPSSSFTARHANGL
jgi:cell wall-associated NlpC family hydrolase